MDTQKRLNSMMENNIYEQEYYIKQINFFKSIQDKLELLPDELSINFCFSDSISLSAYCYSNKDVKELCAKVRKVLGVSRSDKELDSRTGLLSYVTKNPDGDIKVIVNGGSIPEGCELIEKQEIRKVYSMKCN